MSASGSFEAFSRVGGWDKYEHYFPIYDRFLDQFRGRPVRMLEIGVSRGGSIAGWREYFGADRLEYYGLDNDPECQRFSGPGVTILTGDQGERAFVAEIADRLPALDLVIDDGGHVASQQVASFEAFFPRLVQGGIYIVEDTHTSFWPAYQSVLSIRGETRAAGAIDYFCALVPDMMERWWDERARGRFSIPRAQRQSPAAGVYARNLYGVSFYDSLIVLEKREVLEPLRLKPR